MTELLNGHISVEIDYTSANKTDRYFKLNVLGSRNTTAVGRLDPPSALTVDVTNCNKGNLYRNT